MRFRTIAFALFIAVIARAEERRLIPIEAAPIPATGTQDRPHLATNGRDYVAVWNDQREPSGPKLYAMHFDAAGKPAEKWGHSIPMAGPNALIASDGSNYLVVGYDGQTTRTLLLDEKGNAQREARVLNVRDPEALASNGTSYLLIQREYVDAVKYYAVLLDLDGRIIRRYELPYYSYRGLAVDHLKHYRFVASGPGPQLTMVTLSETGDLERFALVSGISVSNFTVAYSSDRVFLAFRDYYSNGATVYVNVYDDAGRRIGPQWIRDGVPGELIGAFPDAGKFTLVIRSGSNYTFARFNEDGSLFQPFTAAYQAKGWTQFATNGESVLAVWENNPYPNIDLYAYGSPSFDPQGMVSSASTLITKSLPSQYDVQIARGGGHELAVYRDNDGFLRAALDGEPIAFASKKPVAGLAAIQAGNENFLVTWREGKEETAQALGARISLDGQALDAQPFDLGPIRMVQPVDDQQDIAYFDSHFTVATGDDAALHTVNVSNIGELSDQRSKIFIVSGAVRWPRIMRSDSNLVIAALVAWNSRYSGSWSTAELVSLKDDYVRLGGFPVGTFAGLGAAVGDRIMLAFKGTPAPGEVAQTAPNGVQTLMWRYSSLWDAGSIVQPRIVANGDQFLMAWSEHEQWQTDVSLRAVRLNAAGDRIGDVIELAAHDGGSDAKPSIALTEKEIRIAYSRVDPDSGGAVLAFVQTFPR